jgi:hypothetical protein
VRSTSVEEHQPNIYLFFMVQVNCIEQVWKSTNLIGCGSAFCSSMGGYIFVCNYYPEGNVIGQFSQNVFPQTDGGTSSTAAAGR